MFRSPIFRSKPLRPARLACRGSRKGIGLAVCACLALAVATRPCAQAQDRVATQTKLASLPSLPPNSLKPGPDGLLPGVKHGSLNDVEAVGKRNIGGRGLGNWYSPRIEAEMGREYAAEIDKSVPLVTDPVVDAYINRIGQNLVKNSDAKVPFTFRVLDSSQINAFALPGGYLYVSSGLILAADNEAELAAVMAHEIAHVAAHHAMRQMTREHYSQLGSAPLILLGGWAGYGVVEASNLALPLAFLQYSRQFEAQADYLGVEYLYRAGYDPTAMITFFEKIAALDKKKPGAMARAFATHPQTPARILATENEIAHILPPRSEYLENTSAFAAVQTRLLEMQKQAQQNHPAVAVEP